MKKIFIFCSAFFCAYFIASGVYAQTAKEAVMALKKLEARTEAGISYKDYGPALGGAKFPVSLFLESPESDKNAELKASIKNAMFHYEYAGTVWQSTLSNTYMKGFLTKDMEELVINRYPKANESFKTDGGARTTINKSTYLIPEAVYGIIWAEASREVKQATVLLAQETMEEQSELDTLRAKVQELTAENAKLKQQLSKKRK